MIYKFVCDIAWPHHVQLCLHFLAAASAQRKAGSTLRSSRAVPHPSTNRALRRLTSEVGRDPVHSTRYGRQRHNCIQIVMVQKRYVWFFVRAQYLPYVLANLWHPACTSLLHNISLAAARKQAASKEILLWMTPSEAPKALQASECSELLDPMRASCWISAQH